MIDKKIRSDIEISIVFTEKGKLFIFIKWKKKLVLFFRKEKEEVFR